MPRTLAQNAQYINETIKPAIKSAIEAQGVTVPSTDSFLDYADRIGEIEGGGSGYQLKDLPTGSISTVNDAAELPLNALKVSVEAWQEGTGDPSPSNVRPIHGWDSGEIGVVGKNWFDGRNIIIGYSINPNPPYNTYPTPNWSLVNYLEIKGGATYTATVDSDGTANTTYVLYDADKTPIIGGNGKTFSTPQNAKYIRFDFKINQENYVQLELGNQATTYEPYQGNTTTLNFPQTIYGAEWDVTDGGLYNTYRHIIVPNDITVHANPAGWNLHYPSYYFYISESGISTNRPTCISNAMLGVSRTQLQIIDKPLACAIAGGGNEIDFTADVSTPAEAKQLLLDNGIEFLYELRTPQTIPQQPLSIRLLQGTNNIYADCGEVIEGEYFVDEGAHRYQLYDYIESDGTQVIDLGFAPENGATVTTSFVLLSTQTSEAFVYGATDNSAWLGFAQNPASRNTIYENNTSGRSESYIKNQQYLLTLTASRDYTNHLCMFGFYLNGYAPGIKTRLCYCKYNDNFYLPAKRKSDGVFGLYDVTNQTFFTDSAGGNAFVGGNPVGVEV